MFQIWISINKKLDKVVAQRSSFECDFLDAFYGVIQKYPYPPSSKDKPNINQSW
jgi:hypothetical protein